VSDGPAGSGKPTGVAAGGRSQRRTYRRSQDEPLVFPDQELLLPYRPMMSSMSIQIRAA
jgi:hypothetical protein